MTVEKSEPADVADDLRARYLPVSRKELRRQREADRAERGEPPFGAPEAQEAEVVLAPEAAIPISAVDAVDRPAREDSAPDAPVEGAGDVATHPEGEAEAVEETAPVPASRRARRLLRDTGSLEVLTEEHRREIHELTEEVTAQSTGDPDQVDPELLKRQQELAARAMKANQERLRQPEQVSPSGVRLSQPRRESEVITRRALRGDHSSEEPRLLEASTEDIDPVEAHGAHGLELDEIVEQTSRQASRQARLLWLVIVLAVVLLVAFAVVFFTVL